MSKVKTALLIGILSLLAPALYAQGGALSMTANRKSVSTPVATPGDMEEACKAVGMRCDYNSRYALIDQVFSASTQVLFDKQSNPYTKGMKDEPYLDLKPPRFYIGIAEQNAKLARNIRANTGLFQAGKLSTEAAKRWKMVD